MGPASRVAHLAKVLSCWHPCSDEYCSLMPGQGLAFFIQSPFGALLREVGLTRDDDPTDLPGRIHVRKG